MVEGGSLEKVQVVEGEGLWSRCLRCRALFGMISSVAEVEMWPGSFSGIQYCSSLQTVQLSGACLGKRDEWK